MYIAYFPHGYLECIRVSGTRVRLLINDTGNSEFASQAAPNSTLGELGILKWKSFRFLKFPEVEEPFPEVGFPQGRVPKLPRYFSSVREMNFLKVDARFHKVETPFSRSNICDHRSETGTPKNIGHFRLGAEAREI